MQTVDANVAQSLSALHIRAKTLAEGVLAGLHRSRRQGGAVEFAEYAEYVPGHELRRIDWKVYGKSDKLYVRNFEEETNLSVYLVVDGSGSMNFAGPGISTSKLEFHHIITATLAYLFLRQGDSVGLISALDGKVDYLRALSRTQHLEHLCQAIEALPGGGEFSLERALETIAERARPRSVIVVCSDFLTIDDTAFSQMAVLSGRGHDLIAFHLVDPAELSLPYEGMTQFEGLEGEGEILVDPDGLRRRYQEVMQSHLRRVQEGMSRARVSYQKVVTSASPATALLQFVSERL